MTKDTGGYPRINGRDNQSRQRSSKKDKKREKSNRDRKCEFTYDNYIYRYIQGNTQSNIDKSNHST